MAPAFGKMTPPGPVAWFHMLAGSVVSGNGGRGPDVIACVEVETIRAAELLRDTLNHKLDAANAEPTWRYTQVAMKNLDGGRHIAPCLITRLNVAHAATRQPDRRLRILEAQVAAILILILGRGHMQGFFVLGQVALWIATIAALVSAADYWRKFNLIMAAPPVPVIDPSASAPPERARGRISA